MTVFSKETNELGEAPLWHPQRNSLLWLDILHRRLFEKSFDSQNPKADSTWLLPEYASAMAQDKYDANIIWMVTNKSFGKYDLSKCSYNPVLSLSLDRAFRSNDGGVSPDGAFWFGTMEWSPSGINGSIYSISTKAILRKQNIRIGIPNTFCWNPNGKVIYISDSFQRKIFSFEVKNHRLDAKKMHVFVDLSDEEQAPDGGTFDNKDFLWNAHWDGHKVVKYNAYGEITEEISMPVPKPSSCCFGGPNYQHLFITSARATMNKKEIENYPLSGNVFVEEQTVPGSPARPFCLDT